MYENKKILILGAARSGIAVAKLLANKNNDITLSDLKDLDSSVYEELSSLGIKIIITKDQISLIDQSYDLIIKNPAISYTSPLVTKINELNIRLENEMEVAFHFLPKDIKIIGITGSNGKTTTTSLIRDILLENNSPVVVGGNIGLALSQIVLDVKPNDILLLEISDHQLLDFHDFKTDISVLTNLYPSHLDYHGTYEHYKQAKKIIFNHHTENDLAIINNSDECLALTDDIKSKKMYFNNELNYYNEEGIFINNELFVKIEDIFLQGDHNYENVLMAILVAKTMDISDEVIKKVLKNFNGVEHRLEFVGQKNGVKFYNDSKSTNPTATITALKTFNEPIHLILGGEEREQDFYVLKPYMEHVSFIYAIGTVTNRVKTFADDLNIPCIKANTLENAMTEIFKNVHNKEVVLLSPASASQDFYAKFEERGEEFKKLVAKF